MDNPQHYLPLSHALDPPVSGTSQSQPQYTMYSTNPNGVNPQEEEEEEEDDDEGVVEEQLNENHQAGSPSPGEAGCVSYVSK
jgi:ABC-type oligopeptide transport system substrate-binding subunit